MEGQNGLDGRERGWSAVSEVGKGAGLGMVIGGAEGGGNMVVIWGLCHYMTLYICLSEMLCIWLGNLKQIVVALL